MLVIGVTVLATCPICMERVLGSSPGTMYKSWFVMIEKLSYQYTRCQQTCNRIEILSDNI